MNDFKHFEGTPKQSDSPKQSEPPKDSGELNSTIELVKALGQAINGKSSKDILATIYAQAEQGKRNGTLTNAEIDNFYASVAPFVDSFKRKKLQELLKKLKEIN